VFTDNNLGYFRAFSNTDIARAVSIYFDKDSYLYGDYKIYVVLENEDSSKLYFLYTLHDLD